MHPGTVQLEPASKFVEISLIFTHCPGMPGPETSYGCIGSSRDVAQSLRTCGCILSQPMFYILQLIQSNRILGKCAYTVSKQHQFQETKEQVCTGIVSNWLFSKPQQSQKSSQNATRGGSCVHFLEQWLSYWLLQSHNSHKRALTLSQNATRGGGCVHSQNSILLAFTKPGQSPKTSQNARQWQWDDAISWQGKTCAVEYSTAQVFPYQECNKWQPHSWQQVHLGPVWIPGQTLFRHLSARTQALFKVCQYNGSFQLLHSSSQDTQQFTGYTQDRIHQPLL